jgi:serine/threonine-protein kinase RIO1
MMDDMMEDNELYCDDIYLDSRKKQKSKQLSVRNPANLDKARSNVLIKVRQLPITRQSAEVLSKLVVNHKIKDIVKVLKIGKNAVTIHAKANTENKVFEMLKNNDNVVIKVFYEMTHVENEVIAYSRNIHNEEKEPATCPYPSVIYTDVNYLRETMTLYRAHNIVVLKMLEKTKTITQMIEENSGKRASMLEELLTLPLDIKNRDFWLWVTEFSCIRNIVWCSEKWVILNVIPPENYSYDHKKSAAIFSGIIMNILDLFYNHGMSLSELEQEFKRIYSGHLWTWKGEVFSKVIEEYFLHKEIHGKLPRKYIKAKFPKTPKQSRKGQK